LFLLFPPLLKPVSVMAKQALHPSRNLHAAATGKPHSLPGGKKRPDLRQTQLACSKHADRHPQFARSDSSRLAFRWKRVAFDRAWESPYDEQVGF
jgi:hypothetical protein